MAKRILLTLIKIYQLSIGTFYTSPCRFFPSCSNYSIEAIRLHGAIKGGFLSLKRFLKCNPWGGRGYDPVPLKKNHHFSKK